MKKIIYLFLLAMFFSFTLFAETEKEKDARYEREGQEMEKIVQSCKKEYIKWVKNNPIRKEAVYSYCYYKGLQIVTVKKDITDGMRITIGEGYDLAYRRLMCLETNCQNMPKE